MLFKRLTLSGFKSFADKVDFDFGTGITGIVGPNGCGKSNVLDSVKWVLGEQSARSLRGRQMMDMIFNGSSSRKSSSVAQVDLHFDNSDRTLTLDQDDIVVTRKLYRSGESEYLLNGAPSRLKDIRELFMDTGVGTEAYSVIEQGKVDVLLQSSPQERRAIFEEAAGISKYKARKREATRKMERTEQNLLRVADVVEEVERRLRSVKLQAGKARNYLEYEERLNELKASYSMAEYHRFTQQLDRHKTAAAQHEDRITGHKTAINRFEADESQLTLSLDDIAEQINDADNRLVRTQSEMATQTERIDAARQRIDEDSEALQRHTERETADKQRLATCETQLEEARQSAEDLESQTRAYGEKIDELNEQDAAVAREVTQASAMLEDEKAGIIELLRETASTHNEIIRLNTHRESLVGQKGRLFKRDAAIKSELETLLEQKASLNDRVREVDSLITQETSRLEEKKAEATRVNSLRQRLVDSVAQSKEQRSALQSRGHVLEDLEQKKDGLHSGVRRVLEWKETMRDTGRLDSVAGLVADVFSTDVSHAHIIEATIGDCDQYLVVRDSRTFLEELQSLGELPGPITALCLDRLEWRTGRTDFSSPPGFVANALDLVQYPPAMDRLARYLLGRTVVVETRRDALRFALGEHEGYRFVTMQGEVIETDGSVRLGKARSHAGLISRRSELRDIDVQLSMLEDDLAQREEELNQTQAQVGHLERIQQELRAAIYENNTAKVEARSALQNIEESIRRLTEEQPLIANEVAMLEQQIDDVHRRSEEGDRSLEEMKAENQRREQIGASYQARIDEAKARRHALQQELTDVRIAAGQLTEKRAAAAERITSLRRQIQDLHISIEAVANDRAHSQRRLDEARNTIATSEQQLAALTESAQSFEQRATELRRRREDLRVKMETLGQSIKRTRIELEEAERLLHEAQMSLGQTNVRRDELCERVKEELDIDLSERYGEYEHTDQDWEAVEAEIAELRAKISRLGNVNLDAITELDELEERHVFLTTQRDDLTESIRQLSQLIEKLNDESLERFQKSFNIIRENFRGLFRKLFGGGKADIVLEDPDNLLECGIEVLAMPPGKDLQSISLMSGGEKTMTAIALLMAIFESRPAPYAILDEVDAALDEANNERFNRIIQDFAKSSQFIVITHSKRTMSIADILYGVTMQEPGVSTRVSVNVADTNVA